VAATPACARTAATRRGKRKMLDFDGLNAVIGTGQLLAQGRRHE
jgi:hypothetical protein